MDDIGAINGLARLLVRSLEEMGIRASVNYANRPDVMYQPDDFDTQSFIKLRAAKRGQVEQIEFARTVAFADVQRLGVSNVAERFRKDAAHALRIEVL